MKNTKTTIALFQGITLIRIKTIYFSLFILCLLSRTLPCAYCESPNPIKLGCVLALTGPVATENQGFRRGIELAVNKVNQSGGIHGRNVIALFEDSNLSPRVALTATHRLIQQGVSGLIFAGAQRLNQRGP